MPPYIKVNQDDIDNLHADVQSYLDTHNGLISFPVLADKFHRIRYYYGDELYKECLDVYEPSGKMVEDRYGLKRYPLWRKRTQTT